MIPNELQSKERRERRRNGNVESLHTPDIRQTEPERVDDVDSIAGARDIPRSSCQRLEII